MNLPFTYILTMANVEVTLNKQNTTNVTNFQENFACWLCNFLMLHCIICTWNTCIKIRIFSSHELQHSYNLGRYKRTGATSNHLGQGWSDYIKERDSGGGGHTLIDLWRTKFTGRTTRICINHQHFVSKVSSIRRRYVWTISFN